MPKNWKRKEEKVKREKLGTFHDLIYFTHVPTVLKAILKNLAIKIVLSFLNLQISLTKQSDRQCKTPDG